MVQLTAENLSLAYDGAEVVRELSMAIPPRQISALIGANGSGKSTLLKGLARVMKPKAGAVYLDCRPSTAFPRGKSPGNWPCSRSVPKRRKG